MAREMYKKDRQMSESEAKELFAKGHHGTLAVNGDDGYPYAVPVNYIYVKDKIYIHSAKYGYKMDALAKDTKVCFSAILSSEIVPDQFTAKFESIVAVGDAVLVDSDEEKYTVLETFINNFSADFKEGGMKFVKAAFEKTAIIRIDVKELKGKAYRG